MNENLKLVLIALGILAVYHFFFRSVTPISTAGNGSDGDSIEDGLTDAPDFGGIDNTEIREVPDGRTSFSEAADRADVNDFDHETTISRGSTTVIGG